MRPEQLQPLTREEHIELGRELKKTRVRLDELAVLVAEVYGAQNHAVLAFEKIVEALEELSKRMQAQAAEDLRPNRAEPFYT